MKKGLRVVGILLLLAVLGGCYGDRNQACQPTVRRIQDRDTLLVGTTGDYRPLSYREADNSYWGFCIDVARIIADKLDVKLAFVPTSWPTLTDDVLADPQAFDLAIGGARKRCG